jgi:hypothetical protein
MQDVTGGLAADGQSRALLSSFIIVGAIQHHWVVLLDEFRCPQAHLQVNLASTNEEKVGLKLSNPAMQQQDVTCYMTKHECLTARYSRAHSLQTISPRLHQSQAPMTSRWFNVQACLH